MIKKIIVESLILILPLLTLFGCSNITPSAKPTVMPDFNEKYFLSDQPCIPPCWQGLTIGISTNDEILKKFADLEFAGADRLVIKQEHLPDFDPEADWVEGKIIVVDCKNRYRCMEVFVIHNKLREIIFRPDNGLKLADVIESFGNPDYLYPFLIDRPERDCEIEIIWIEKQLMLYSAKVGHSLEDIRNCHGVVQDGILPKDLIIVDVHYLPIEEIHHRLGRLTYTEYKGLK